LSGTVDRVVHHINDLAAVEYEHGDDLVGDMLKAEANRLQVGGLSIFAVEQPDDPAVVCVHSLRAHSHSRKERQRAADRCEELIAEAWLREGYSTPC